MPDFVSFDLKQLVRVCLNDPDLKRDIEDALAEGALPVRTPIVNVGDGAQTFQATLKTNREKSPGDSGFAVRDNVGWLSARLAEIIKTEHDASTISADQVAEKLGVTVDQLKKGG